MQASTPGLMHTHPRDEAPFVIYAELGNLTLAADRGWHDLGHLHHIAEDDELPIPPVNVYLQPIDQLTASIFAGMAHLAPQPGRAVSPPSVSPHHLSH